MKKNKLQASLDSIKKYQRSMYLPDFYSGNAINPAFRARPKVVGYLILFYAGFVLLLSFLQMLVKATVLDVWAVLLFLLGIALLFLGIKTVKHRSS